MESHITFAVVCMAGETKQKGKKKPLLCFERECCHWVPMSSDLRENFTSTKTQLVKLQLPLEKMLFTACQSHNVFHGLKSLTQCVSHCRRLNNFRTTMQTEKLQRTFLTSNIHFIVNFSAVITQLTLCSLWLLKEIVIMNTFRIGDSKIPTWSLCHLKFRWNCLLL